MTSSHLEHTTYHGSIVQPTFVADEILREMQTFQTKIIQFHIKEINAYASLSMSSFIMCIFKTF